MFWNHKTAEQNAIYGGQHAFDFNAQLNASGEENVGCKCDLVVGMLTRKMPYTRNQRGTW